MPRAPPYGFQGADFALILFYEVCSPTREESTRDQTGEPGTDGRFSNKRLGRESSQPDPGCIIFLSPSM